MKILQSLSKAKSSCLLERYNFKLWFLNLLCFFYGLFNLANNNNLSQYNICTRKWKLFHKVPALHSYSCLQIISYTKMSSKPSQTWDNLMAARSATQFFCFKEISPFILEDNFASKLGSPYVGLHSRYFLEDLRWTTHQTT